MKIRTGFVSNSSSSSFVVAGPIEKDSITITFNLCGQVLRSEEEVNECYDQQYSDPKYYKNSAGYKLAISSVKEGKPVLVGNIDNDLVGIMNGLDPEYNVEVDY